MPNSEPPKSTTPRASWLGTLPGPKTGMTLSTEQVINHLGKRLKLRGFDIYQGFKGFGKIWKLKKALRSLQGALAILLTWKSLPGECFYQTGNSRGGLYADLLIVWAARCRGFLCIYHHHVYTYIHKHDWRMKLLLKALGQEAIHVMACKRMVDDFNQKYGSDIRHFIMPPMIVPPKERDLESQNDFFTLGHLANLTVEKGLVRVLDTFARLRKKNLPVRLVIAGPCSNDATRATIADFAAEYGEWFEYRGPVYDDQKSDFFADIDAFVFPSMTPNESWGIVLNEALANGVPVVTFDRACIKCMVGDAGKVFDPAIDFAEEAVTLLERWIQNRDEYHAVASAAMQAGKRLEIEIREKFDGLIELMQESRH